ncbi:MAG: hypothetical protein K9J21_06905 [Bacteroidales bacterium]|nr:hypothetical protein [Bacteroidales bacterium]
MRPDIKQIDGIQLVAARAQNTNSIFVEFPQPMPDAEYAVNISSFGVESGEADDIVITERTPSDLTIEALNGFDDSVISVIIHY